MRRTREEIEAAAYHEAGHVVVAYCLGWSIQAASIRRRNNVGGYIKGHSRKTGDEAIAELELVLIAGPEAERLYIWLWGTEKQQKNAEANGLPGAGDDVKKIAELEGRDLKRENDRREVLEKIDRFSPRVRAILSSPALVCPWHAVAAELLNNHSLSGEQMRLIIERAVEVHEGIPSAKPGILGHLTANLTAKRTASSG